MSTTTPTATAATNARALSQALRLFGVKTTAKRQHARKHHTTHRTHVRKHAAQR